MAWPVVLLIVALERSSWPPIWAAMSRMVPNSLAEGRVEVFVETGTAVGVDAVSVEGRSVGVAEHGVGEVQSSSESCEGQFDAVRAGDSIKSDAVAAVEVLAGQRQQCAACEIRCDHRGQARSAAF